VDATAIEAPSLTGNKVETRVLEMYQTKNDNQWQLVILARSGIDADSGGSGTFAATATIVSDVIQAYASCCIAMRTRPTVLRDNKLWRTETTTLAAL